MKTVVVGGTLKGDYNDVNDLVENAVKQIESIMGRK